MAAKPGQKTFHAEVDEALHAELSDWIALHGDPSMKQCIVTGVSLFLAMPEPIQALLMICPHDSPFWEAAAHMVEQTLMAQGLARDAQTTNPRRIGLPPDLKPEAAICECEEHLLEASNTKGATADTRRRAHKGA